MTALHAAASAAPALHRRRVAVVGAGAAGLVSARELRECGHAVTVFEASSTVGGTWQYTPQTGVHSSVYESLRTNLPREVMTFSDFGWSRSFAGDERRFCGHREVAAYLEAFASEHALRPLVRFQTPFASAAPAPGGGWTLSTGHGTTTEQFDALLVANGHYSVPRWPDIPGLAELAAREPGRVTHSHDYRTPAAFAGLRVAVVGGAASGEDLSAELGTVARSVLWSSSGFETTGDGKVMRRPLLVRVYSDGGLCICEFADGRRDEVDVVLLATGYRFAFPFLSPALLDSLSLADNAISLYQHCAAPALLTSSPLFFIGLPWKVLPFPLCELQAKWAARLLSGAIPSPSPLEMERWLRDWEDRLQPVGPLLRRHAHAMSVDEQFSYLEALADAAGVARLPGWRKRMFLSNSKNRRARPGAYRDVWDKEDESQEQEAEELPSVR